MKNRPSSWRLQSTNQKLRMALRRAVATENKDVDGMGDLPKVEMKRIAVGFIGEEQRQEKSQGRLSSLGLELLG